jgi:predicted nucleic acid-binding protein
MRRLVAKKGALCFVAQNLGKFWNVSTRPLKRNGFGLPVPEAARRFESTIRNMTLLSEAEGIYAVWLRLLKPHEVRGVQVHDAHLAAVLEIHKVAHLLTFNAQDFKRFSNVIAVHSEEVLVP